MKLSEIGEFGLIKKLQKKCLGVSPDILTGIGDDAAVVRVSSGKIVITSDMLIEGVHFDLSYTTFRQLGYKFLAVNVSDIFAMGGLPRYFFVNLGIPKTVNVSHVEELYSGIEIIAQEHGVAVAGGDTCASKHGLILSGTLVGKTERIITRSGAKTGDGIFVSKTLGDSAMGLHLLKKRKQKILNFAPMIPGSALMKRHLMPEPVPLKKTSQITSMTDISDGLLMDLSHLCDQSNVGAVLYRENIPISRELAITAQSLNRDPVTFALQGGEDYALLFTAPRNYKTNAYKIGEVIRKGLFIINGKGKRTTLKPEGYEHFKRQESGFRGQSIKN